MTTKKPSLAIQYAQSLVEKDMAFAKSALIEHYGRKSTAKTNKQKQSELRDRRTALGLKRLEVWARPADHPKIRAYVKRLEIKKCAD